MKQITKQQQHLDKMQELLTKIKINKAVIEDCNKQESNNREMELALSCDRASQIRHIGITRAKRSTENRYFVGLYNAMVGGLTEI